MPSFENIACPRCSRSLRLPVEVLDQSVRCPLCQATFIAGARQSTLDTLPETSSVKKFPPVGSLSLDDDIPPVPLAVEENDTALDEVEILEPPPPPPPLLRPIVPEGKPFAPVPFVLFVLNDPHDDLEGRYRAEVDAKGVHFWRGKNRVITAPPGSKAKYRYGTRLSLEVEGRMVEMTVVREEGLAEELAQQIVKFLQGKRDEVRLPKPRSYLLLPLVLLPLGIPLLAAIAGGFNGPPGGLMVWTFAALLVVGINCGLTFGLS
ncbi:MAG: hypothetical protein EBV06_12855, partial [Planctomycetia bacterium]|nr:hypothetical protein [Planctomycetia bacterium]